MKPTLSRLLGAAICAAVLPLSAHAQNNCGARDAVISKLASGYGEAFAGGGLQSSTRIVEVWMSEEKGTWTILVTRPDGSTCVLAAGTHWRDGEPATPVAKGTPS